LQKLSTSASPLVIGVLYGALAALGWAAGFVVAKHGIEIGFAPADLVLHRFVWTGLFMLPVVARMGFGELGGIGWGRGLTLALFSGPPQSMLAYTGFILVPLGHGTVIQPACATLFGLILATVFLGEPISTRRVIGALTIVGGLVVFGIEAITTIGPHGVGGDLLFASAGISWAVFGTLLRRWQVPGLTAALVVGTLSFLLFTPVHALFFGYENIIRLGLWENLLQAVAQGLFAGVLPIYLFGRTVVLLGAGRAGTFTALVPGFALIIGYLALGIVPSLAQLAGLLIVMIGFQFTVRR
jgi:drug/metabolite transporter (DMT)-like permease